MISDPGYRADQPVCGNLAIGMAVGIPVRPGRGVRADRLFVGTETVARGGLCPIRGG